MRNKLVHSIPWLCPLRRTTQLGVLLLLGTVGAIPTKGEIELNVTRVGFKTLGMGDVIRVGTWTPVLVDVALLNQPSFDGRLRVGTFDSDGDECFDVANIHLSAEAGGSRRAVLYMLPDPLNVRRNIYVELLNTDGEVVEVVSQGEVSRRGLPSQQPTVMDSDTLLILSVSQGTIGQIADLAESDVTDSLTRPISIAHASPADLPEHWLGLEAVDIIRWDNANPSDLTARQLRALVEWVREGGTLLIMASTAEEGIALDKELGDILPAHLGNVVTVPKLDNVYKRLLGGDSASGSLDYSTKRVGALQCQVKPGATVVSREELIGSDLVTRRCEGRGHVILVGMCEKDLLAGKEKAAIFYPNMFLLQRKDKTDLTIPDRVSLFRYVLSGISFGTSGSAYLAMAGLFSVAYVLLVTLGSWWFLRIRGWTRHSWTTFAVLAVSASALSVVSVNTVRGISTTGHQLSVVDGVADSPVGYATTFFGVKTGTDQTLDLWLPSDPLIASEPRETTCFLRPIPQGNNLNDISMTFADPGKYQLFPASAMLKDVRFRATLKQFEGRWRGRLPGKITADIKVNKGWRITPESYISNQLGVDLKNCYLLHAFADIVAPESRPSTFHSMYNRAHNIYAFPLGDLPADGSRILLADRCYKPMGDHESFLPGADWKLVDAHQDWSREFQTLLRDLGFGRKQRTQFSLGSDTKALLLMSTIGEYEPGAAKGNAWGGIRTWSRDRLRHLDFRTHLQRDCVILIGFAKDPGPVRLFKRKGNGAFSPIEPKPDYAQTMYRIRIPLTLLAGDVENPDDTEGKIH